MEMVWQVGNMWQKKKYDLTQVNRYWSVLSLLSTDTLSCKLVTWENYCYLLFCLLSYKIRYQDVLAHTFNLSYSEG